MQNLHPLFVHFPIALLLVSVFCHLLGLWLKKEPLVISSWWMQVFGTVAIVVTATTGLIAEATVPHSDEAHELILDHKTWELVATGLFVVIFIWRMYWGTKMTLLYLVFSVFAVSIMAKAAYDGGRIVYEFGVGGNAVKFEEHHKHSHDDKDESDHDGIKKDSLKSSAHTLQKSEHHAHIYVCPMHPDVISDKPGKCTKCGMELELKEHDHED